MECFQSCFPIELWGFPCFFWRGTVDFFRNFKNVKYFTDLEEGIIEVGPDQMIPYWPQHGAKEVIAKIKNTKEWSRPFTLQTVHSTLLMLNNKYGGLYVDVRTSASETLLTISSYKRGQAPVQLINQTQNQMIQYGEKGSKKELFLAPNHSAFYTWINPQGERTFIWGHDESKEYENPLMTDDQGWIDLGPNQYLAWVSFLDGMQRVLLFTDDPNKCLELTQNERIAMVRKSF